MVYFKYLVLFSANYYPLLVLAKNWHFFSAIIFVNFVSFIRRWHCMTCMTKSGISLSKATFAHGKLSFAFTWEASFSGSQLVVVSAMKPYQCTDCSKRFTTDNGRANHQRAVHGKPVMNSLLKSYQCTVCPKRFATDDALKNHMERSTNKKHQKMRGNMNQWY